MKKNIHLFLLIIMLCFILSPMIVLSEKTSNEIPGVVCTTSVLSYLTQEIGQEAIVVTTIAPAGMCPAHFDIKPSQIQAVREAKILISHNFEPWIENLINASDNTAIERLILSGPWNTPESAIEKIGLISSILVKRFPEDEQYFILNAQKLIQSVRLEAEKIKNKSNEFNVSQFKVISSFHQASFVEWLGFQSVTTYPSPETISTKQYLELLLVGKKENPAFIVDNLQSGTDFGAKMASDLHANHVVLTNFPGLVPQTESLSAMLSYNAEQLFKAIQERTNHD